MKRDFYFKFWNSGSQAYKYADEYYTVSHPVFSLDLISMTQNRFLVTKYAIQQLGYEKIN